MLFIVCIFLFPSNEMKMLIPAKTKPANSAEIETVSLLINRFNSLISIRNITKIPTIIIHRTTVNRVCIISQWLPYNAL